ncbi:MAG: efflux RND transporter periplasmic adaptor subunit [Mariniphaga sp.]|nr:efflux RND transporter periplasmic adaptor subunit [Mariniphaga sp.]
MKRNFAFILLVVLFIGNACSMRKSNEVVDSLVQVGLPPSLSGPSDVSLVKLTSQQQQDLQIQTSLVKSNVVRRRLAAPGVVYPAPDHSSIISAPIAGQIQEIFKHEGTWVKKGEVLFHVQSLEFGTLVSDYLQAHAEEEYQRSRLARLKQLVEETISSVSELEQATSVYRRASASVRAAYSRLKALGVLDREIDALIQSENIDPILRVHSPISGTIEKNFMEKGQSVNALENLSRVLDTRTVLVRGYFSPDEARLIQTGDTVNVMRREDGSDLRVTATVSSINPGLDENSRSVVVNILVSPNSDWPFPGENVRLEVLSSSSEENIAIPVESLSYDGNQAVVFVQKEPGVFEKRVIELLEIGARQVLVASGLQEGERVASSRVFSLKALSRYDIISEE